MDVPALAEVEQCVQQYGRLLRPDDDVANMEHVKAADAENVAANNTGVSNKVAK